MLRESPLLVRRAFFAGLGAVHVAAFASLGVQVRGLLGSQGILPAAELLERVRERAGGVPLGRVPTLLWLGCDDALLVALCAAGAGLGALLAAGLAPLLILPLLFALYLSLVTVGGVFLSYQWDVLLLETTAAALLVAPIGLRPRDAWRSPVPVAGVLALRWLVFRLFFMSGCVKLLSGDASWRGLDALRFHYESQPLPAWTSWYAHALPASLHAVVTAGALAIELALPLLAFGPRRARLVACAGLAGLQLAIAATGNYGFFNPLCLVLCLWLLDDRALAALLPGRLRRRLPPVAALPRAPRREIAVAAAALALALLSLVPLLGRLRPETRPPDLLLRAARVLAPFHVANGYGLFAVMTTERPEILVEGSLDGRVWRPYVFPSKPGPLHRAPRFVQPHQPRLDWQLWFAALRGCPGARSWFPAFAERLLRAAPPVLALLEEDPFGGVAPRYLRSSLHRYRFTTPEQRRRSGAWWRREVLGPYCPVFTLEGGRLSVVRGARRGPQPRAGRSG